MVTSSAQGRAGVWTLGRCMHDCRQLRARFLLPKTALLQAQHRCYSLMEQQHTWPGPRARLGRCLSQPPASQWCAAAWQEGGSSRLCNRPHGAQPQRCARKQRPGPASFCACAPETLETVLPAGPCFSKAGPFFSKQAGPTKPSQPLQAALAWKDSVLTPPRCPDSCARCRRSPPSVLHSCTQPCARADSPTAHRPPSTCR